MGGGREAGMIACLVEPGALEAGAELLLSDAETHHLKVRRASVGDVVQLQDGTGAIASGALVAVGREARVVVEQVHLHAPLPPLRLVVGAGDRERFEWLAEKCAEFGVTELVPLTTAWSDSVASRVRETHLERIAKRAREATKQSGSPWAPRIGPLTSPAEACARFTEGTRWLADAAGQGPRRGTGAPAVAVIGPEGGLTPDEREQFLTAGFWPVRLAPFILRFETAAMTVAALARSAAAGGTND